MPLEIEHPVITEINQLGYPKDVYQEKHWGVDVMGHEIIEGDSIIEIDGEIVLESNLEDFLIEHLGANFTRAT